MNIGFDLDKIFINFPPLIPEKIIDWLYKGKPNGSLKYRIPGKAEQIIRLLSHHPILRLPIIKNLDYVKKLASSKTDKYYLISSRFSFLEKRTRDLIRRYKLDEIFNAMYFNYSNNQPHEFKNKMIQKLNLDMYVDDDLALLEYLAKKNSKTKFFWLNDKTDKILGKNLIAIKNISEMLK